MKKVAIIGAGALGIVTAIMLKDNFEVTLVEKNNKIGKKILASGNGKCNFTNVSDIEGKYNNEYATNIVKSFDSSKTLEFFTKISKLFSILTSPSVNKIIIVITNATNVIPFLFFKLNFLS